MGSEAMEQNIQPLSNSGKQAGAGCNSYILLRESKQEETYSRIKDEGNIFYVFFIGI
ncbi:hypothetical protein GCM10028895_43950 [Pontibacter rugosus]